MKRLAAAIDANVNADALLIVQHGDARQVASGADNAALLERQPYGRCPSRPGSGARPGAAGRSNVRVDAVDLLVPFVSACRPLAVGLGVLAAYVVVAVFRSF